VLDLFFKFMGLSPGKSLQSRASAATVSPSKQGITLGSPENRQEKNRSEHPGAAASARRQEVKAPVKKPIAVKKPVVSAKAGVAKKAAPAKAATSKTVAKPAAKTAAKTAAKPAPKTAAKPATKISASKPAAKPAAKSVKPAKAPQPVLKNVAKSVVKPPATTSKTAKVAAKTVVKAPVKASVKVPVKPPVKAAPKTVASTAKKPASPAPSKSAAKHAAPAAAKPVAKPAVKAPVKSPVKAPAAAKAPAKSAAPAKTAPVKSAPVKSVAAKSQAIPLAPLPGQAAANLGKPVTLVPIALTKPAKTSKSGFISPANIAPRAMEVSTAAKTNFTMSSPVLAPPPQLAVKKDAKLVNNWKTKSAADLTDQEAIAMPDSEYMSALQLAFFRLKLVQLKKDILNSAGETTEHLREDTSVVPDPADRATIEEEHALELRTRDRERKLLKKIEQSIVRIDAEDYGYCDETGEPIGIARLIARPTATLSIEAQQRRELKQKMFGD
jgi:DnaK suppressor protein